MTPNEKQAKNKSFYKFTLTSDIYHEATKRNKTANIDIIETKHKVGYIYNIQVKPTYSIRKKSYLIPSSWRKDAKKLAEKYWQKYLNE